MRNLRRNKRKGYSMKELMLIVVMILCVLFTGCSEYYCVENIEKRYPEAKVYRIDSDEFIVLLPDTNKVIHIETDFNEITSEYILPQVKGFIKDESKK